MLDSRRLAVLREVGRRGSFAAAARALQYTQPAITHHVRRLENEVGTTLVVRDGRRVRLTEAGFAVYNGAERILSDIAAIEAEVAAIAGLRSGSVTVASFPSGTAALLPETIRRLAARYPEIAVCVIDVEPPESLRLLAAGDCDVALTFDYPTLASEVSDNLVNHPLYEDPIFIALPAKHKVASEPLVKLQWLAHDPWIAGCPRCSGYLLELCREGGIEPRIVCTTDDYLAMQAMISAALGVGLVSGLALRAVTLPGIVVRPLDPAPTRLVSAITSSGSRRVPSVAALLEALGTTCSELLPRQVLSASM